MLFSFSSKKLERQLSEEREMHKAFAHVMPNLKRRLSVLSAADCLADVPQTPPEARHALVGDRKGQFAVKLGKNYRLIIEPDHIPIPLLDDGGIDLRAVTAVKIIAIEDYHGD